MNDDVVQVVQGKDCRYLTYYCQACGSRHTIPVLKYGDPERLPTDFRGTWWWWDGSTTSPSLSNSNNPSNMGCIAHSSIKVVDGKYEGKQCDVNIWRGKIAGYGAIYKRGQPILPDPPGFPMGNMVPVKNWPPLEKPPEKRCKRKKPKKPSYK